MRISTDNGPIRNRFGDVAAVKMIADAGFDGIDYTFYEIDPSNDILALGESARAALMRDVLACAQDLGVTFPQAHAPIVARTDEPMSEKAVRDVLVSMEMAAALGCPQIVIHTIKRTRFETIEQNNALNREYLNKFLPQAEALDIDIGVENLFIPDKKRAAFASQHGTPQEMNAFVDSLCSPRFKVCCDLGHAAVVGTEPQDFIAGMDAARMTMLHVQDTDYRSDSHNLPYLGLHDWDAITDALAAIGYRGAMNVELCHFYNKFPDALMGDALRLAARTTRCLADMTQEKMR